MSLLAHATMKKVQRLMIFQQSDPGLNAITTTDAQGNVQIVNPYDLTGSLPGSVQSNVQRYDYDFSNATTIQIQHNIGKYPLVQVIASQGGYGQAPYGSSPYGGSGSAQVITGGYGGGGTIQHVDENNVTISFTGSTTGTVILIG